jgi:hypothetical protein
VSNYPSEYTRLNQRSNKFLNVVFSIDGVDTEFSMVPSYTLVRYGDPGIVYGLPGIVYGGLRRLDGVKPYLVFDQSITFAQRLEPEQGRASISTLSITLIDKNGEVSELVSPGGGIVDEIMGRGVTIRLGFADSSFPDDYVTAFRGVIQGITIQTGRVIFALADANQKRRNQIFRVEKTYLTAGIDAVTTSIPVENSGGFYQQILGPAGTYDPGVKTYIKIDNEIMEYGPAGLAPTSITVTRGARGTTAAIHDPDADVTHYVELTDNALTLALKLMLSGWAGPYESGVAVKALGTLIDPALPAYPNGVLFPPGIDPFDQYGLTVGDYVTISGSTAGNDGVYTVTGFVDPFERPNNGVLLSSNLTIENPASTVSLSFRSRYDTLPTNAGMKIHPAQVDVLKHESLRGNFFIGQENTIKILVLDEQPGKDFIEKQIYFPIGTYSLTRFGRLSVGFTNPPLAGTTLVTLDSSTVVQPTSITQTRSLANRRFFNEIRFEYDRNDAGQFESVLRTADSESLTKIGQTSTLPVQASALRSAEPGFSGNGILINRVSRRLLARYRLAAFEISLTANWAAGGEIEVGDVVMLADNGGLQITNFDSGARSSGSVLYEVIDRTIDVKAGNVKLKLLGGLGFALNDRYGTISPSNLISATGTTNQRIALKASYGQTTSAELVNKWTAYVGQQILIHKPDYSLTQTATLTGFDAGAPSTITVSPTLAWVPAENDVLEIASYPTSTDPLENDFLKAVHAFIDPTLVVVSGISDTQFTVSPSDAAKVQVGGYVIIHNTLWSTISDEAIVSDITGTTITVSTSLGFTPSAGQYVDLVGFPDNPGAYRLT